MVEVQEILNCPIACYEITYVHQYLLSFHLHPNQEYICCQRVIWFCIWQKVDLDWKATFWFLTTWGRSAIKLTPFVLVSDYLKYTGSDQWLVQRDMSKNNEQVQRGGRSGADAWLNDGMGDSLHLDAVLENLLKSQWYIEESHWNVFPRRCACKLSLRQKQWALCGPDKHEGRMPHNRRKPVYIHNPKD